LFGTGLKACRSREQVSWEIIESLLVSETFSTTLDPSSSRCVACL